MSVDESQLTTWAQAPSEAEEDKCRNAVSQITEAVTDEFGTSISIFLQGSYKNRTNVRKDSDVDIVIRHDGYYFGNTYYLSDDEKARYEQIPFSDYHFADFKNDIQRLLEDKFGISEVERKNKCIRVEGNTYRVNADVVPCFVHKRLRTHDTASAEGIEFVSDSNVRVVSFPQQHYDNGVGKNSDTDTMFKSVVRILKRSRNNLVDDGSMTEEEMPSFFLECLVWNIADDYFRQNTYDEALRGVMKTIYNDMGSRDKWEEYAEVSELKWLFKGEKKWTPEQARQFMVKTWAYIFKE